MTTYIDPIETDDAEMTQMREIWREEAREAQRLIREDRRPLSMIELYLVGEESVRQQQILQQTARCQFGCDERELVINPRGETVCRWTCLPCPRVALAQFLERFSIVNRRTVMAKTMATTSAASTAIISATDLAQMQALDQQIAEFREKLADPAIGGMAKMLIQAKAIATLEQAITPAMMRDVMKLMDSPLGFRTDRPPGATDRNGKPLQQYGEATVKRCLIVAWLSGAQATGNEFNIIASNCYLTKSFTRPAILRFPGVSHLELQIGAPFKHSDRTAVVDAIARWRLNGEQHEICCLKTAEMDARIVVNCYQTSSPDEIRGKVEAKLYQRILSRLTGMNMDGDDESAVVNTIEGRVVSALPSEPADADSQIVEAEPAGNGISDAEAARHICEAWQADLEKLEMINDVKVGLKDRLALVQSAEWPKELVDGTIDYITQLANDRMEAIRATRGEKSNS